MPMDAEAEKTEQRYRWPAKHAELGAAWRKTIVERTEEKQD